VRSTVGIVGYAPTYSVILFRVKSVSRPSLIHRVYVQFLDLEKLKKHIGEEGEKGGILEDPVKARDILISIIQSDIKVHCTCESYKYYRSYQMTQLDASIFPETRPPVRNDPALQRTHMCHHLFATMKYLFTYEQHIVKFLMMNDKAIANSLKIDANTAAEIQLQNVIDTWTDKIGDAADDEKLGDVLKTRIVNVLKKAKSFINKFRMEELVDTDGSVPILRENISPEKLIQTTEDFVAYVTNNFIPRDIRPQIVENLEDTIMETFEEYAEINQPPEQEKPAEEELPSEEEQQFIQQGDETDMLKYESIDIEGIARKILANRRLHEAGTPLGPTERPVDDPDTAARERMLGAKYDDIPADELNGADPSELKPEEVAVQNAIEEYARQTGKTAHTKDFKDIVLGIIRDFDSSSKIQQLRRFVGTVTNTTANLREPEEYEPEEDFDLGAPEDEGGMPPESGEEKPSAGLGGEDVGGEENPFSPEELEGAANEEPAASEEMPNKQVMPKVEKPSERPAI